MTRSPHRTRPDRPNRRSARRVATRPIPAPAALARPHSTGSVKSLATPASIGYGPAADNLSPQPDGMYERASRHPSPPHPCAPQNPALCAKGINASPPTTRRPIRQGECSETGSAVTGNPGTPCDEHRAIFVAAAGSGGRPHSNDEMRPPNSSHPNTTGYQLVLTSDLTTRAARVLALPGCDLRRSRYA